MIVGIIIGIIISSLFWILLVIKENRDWADYCNNLNARWAGYWKILINEAFELSEKSESEK